MLSPSGMTLNPDLVFDDCAAVGDVKYKLQRPDWRRGDLYQAVTFAAGFRSRSAAVVGFGHADAHGPPVVKVGDVEVSPFVWDVGAASPAAALRDHQERQQLDAALLGVDPGGLVFTREDGTPLDPGGFSKMFVRLAKAAGCPTIRVHDLRHTYATLALAQGVHPKIVSERLGHSTISITLDTYSHALPVLEESAAELVASLIRG